MSINLLKATLGELIAEYNRLNDSIEQAKIAARVSDNRAHIKELTRQRVRVDYEIWRHNPSNWKCG